MNEKEIGELRRRFRQDRTGISHVRGCYVNETGEIVAQFNQPLGVMTQEDNEKILALLKRTLSGTLGKNLMDITFATQQVVEGEEHKLLMRLRDSELSDEEAVQAFFRTVIETATLEGNYMILLAHDCYDVPYRSKDGERQDDAGEEVFSYVLCSICPVKLTKPGLSYYVQENQFHSQTADWVLTPPELGFLFPAFDERTTNLYGALYYSKSSKDVHDAFVESVFHTQPPMPAQVQMETFQNLLGETLEEECSYSVVQGIRDQLCAMIAEHKERKEAEPLVIAPAAMTQVLSTCGVEQQRIEAFTQRYEEAFGLDTPLSPRNLVDPRQMELKTPDVTIRVNPERSDLVQTRIIDGVKYILIRVEEGVELNGVNLHIHDQNRGFTS